jgi:hypothetical protein
MNSDWFVVKDAKGSLLFCGESWERARDAYLGTRQATIVNNKSLFAITPLSESQKGELGLDTPN